MRPRVARLLHLPALPAMDLRVASNLSSFSAPGARIPGCPDVLALPVAPADASSGLPRLLHLPALPATDPASCPAIRRPSALLALALWVAPQLRSSSCASRCGGGFPRLCTFRLCLGFEFPGRPEFPLPWRRLMVPRVASVPAPSGFAVPASSGFPESCIYGWVDDDFPVLLELCILGGAADESSCPIGPCMFPSDSGCILTISFGPFIAGKPTLKCRVQPHPASSCQTGTAFPIPCQVIN